MIDILAAASVQAAIRQDFPDHFAQYAVRERPRRSLALRQALTLVLSRWQRPPHVEQTVFPVLIPPL